MTDGTDSNIAKLADFQKAASSNDDLVTEDSAAQDFVSLYANELRFDHTIRKWYRWDGQYWRRDDTALAFHHAREQARKLAREQDGKARYITSKVSFAANVERFAQADPRLAVTRDYWNPDKYLLGTPGGTVDLRTGDLRPARSDDLITKQAAIAPSETSNCPLFKAFLRQACNKDDAFIKFIQQFCGYCLTGDTKEQALLFIYGDGGNGKGVLQRVLAGIMNTYSSVAAMDTFMASNFDKHSTDIASLADARLVIASETEEGRAWAEAKIKQLTGGDIIKARFMRRDNFEFMPEFKLFFTGNNQPDLKQVDNAVRRRFNIGPFIFKPVNADYDLEVKLKQEWPAILRWFIEGCLMWQKTGLERPQVVVDATNEYFSEQDSVKHWIDEKCDTKPTLAGTSSNLFKSWAGWCNQNGERPGSQKAFSQLLRKRGFRQFKTNGPRGFYGIDVKRLGNTEAKK